MPTFNHDINIQYDDPINKTLSEYTRGLIVDQIQADINKYCVDTLTSDHRTHLGASVIGHDCSRFIWYAFRWVKKEIFDGRMLRLFERGNLEEQRIIKLLRGIGCKVWEVDPITNTQYRIWAVHGHYGGSQDAAGMLPYLPNMPILFEFKTHNTKSFTNLDNKGLILAKPRHYAQMCAYGKHYGFKYGLYIATNKNDDDIHMELVELNYGQADDLIIKAQEIITTKKPPARIAEHPSYYECKYCSFQGVCHFKEKVEINCRSCRNATAVENASWYCDLYKQVIPEEFIPKGCHNHVSITGE